MAAAAAAYPTLRWQLYPNEDIVLAQDDMAICLAWLCRMAGRPENHLLRKQILGDSVVATTCCCECDCDDAWLTQCLREAKFWETQISSDLLRDLLHNEVAAAGGNPDDDGNAPVVPQGRSKQGNPPTLQTCIEQLMQQLSAPPTTVQIATLRHRVVASWDCLGLAEDFRAAAAVVVAAISKAVQREMMQQQSLPPSPTLPPSSIPKKDDDDDDTFGGLPPLPLKPISPPAIPLSSNHDDDDGEGSLDTGGSSPGISFVSHISDYSSPVMKKLQTGSPLPTPQKPDGDALAQAIQNDIATFGHNVAREAKQKKELRRAEATSQVARATMGTLLDFLLLANCQLAKKVTFWDTQSTLNVALAANKPISSFLDRTSTPIREVKLGILERQLGLDVSSCVSGTCEYAKIDKSASRLLLQRLAQPKSHQNGQIFETLGALLGQNTFLQGGTSPRHHIVAAEMIRRMEAAIEQLEFHLYDECFLKYRKMFYDESAAKHTAAEANNVATSSAILHWLKSFYVRLMGNARGARSLPQDDPGMKLVHQLLTALMKDCAKEDKQQLEYAEALFWADDDADSSSLSNKISPKSFERREQPLPELSKQITVCANLTLHPSRSVLAQTCYELVRIMLFPGTFTSRLTKWMFSPLTSPVPILHAMTWCDAGDGAELLRVIEIMSLTLEDQSTCQARKEFALKLLKIVDQTAPDARNAAIQGGNAFKVRMLWAKFTLKLFGTEEGCEGVLQCVAWAQRLRPHDANLEAIFSDGLLQDKLASIDFACVFRDVYRDSKLVHFHKHLFDQVVIGNAHKCENVAAALRGLRDCTEPLTRCLYALATVREHHEQNNMTEMIQRGISRENWPEHFRCVHLRQRQKIIRGQKHDVFEAKVVVEHRYARFFAIFEGSSRVAWACFDTSTHLFWFVDGGDPAPWTGDAGADDKTIFESYIESTKEAAVNRKLLRIENLALALCVPGFLSLDRGIVDSALSCLREDVTARTRLSEALRAHC